MAEGADSDRSGFFWWSPSFLWSLSFSIVWVTSLLFVLFLVPERYMHPVARRDAGFDSLAIAVVMITFATLAANIVLYPVRRFFRAPPKAAAQAGAGAPEEDRIWIQRFDFSIVPGTPQTADGVYKAFCDFDWRADRKAQEELKAKGGEACSSGLGLGVMPYDRHFIHIIPHSATSAEIVYFKTEKAEKKLLGLFPYTGTNTEQAGRDDFPLSKVRALIDAWFASDDAKIDELVKGK